MPRREKRSAPEIQAAPRRGYGHSRVDNRYDGPVPSLKQPHPGQHRGDLTPEQARRIGYEAAASAAVDRLPHGPALAGPLGYLARHQHEAQGVASVLTGRDLPSALLGEHYSPYGLAFDVGALLPIGRPFKALRAASRAAKLSKGGASGRVVLEGAKAAYREAGPVDRAVGTVAGRAARKAKQIRVFRHEGAAIEIPAAASRTGRAVEKLVDEIRPATSKTVVKSEAERYGVEFRHQLSRRQKVLNNPADALRKVGRKLNSPQQYVLRILAEGISPAERAAEHADMAVKTTDRTAAIYHAIHADLIGRASKYVGVDELGKPYLLPDAPQKLKDAWRLLQEVSGAREDVYRELGRLTDQSIADRIQAPGRVLKGARFHKNEQVVRDALDANPIRQELHTAIDATAATDAQKSAAKSLLDAQARSYAQHLEQDPVNSVGEFFSHITGVEHTNEIPQGALRQAAWAPGEEDLSHLTKDLGGPTTNADLERIVSEQEAVPHPEAPADPEVLLQRGGALPGVSRLGVKGAVSFNEAGDALIHLTEHADLSTIAHEGAHVLRRTALSPHEEAVAGRWAGAETYRDSFGHTRVVWDEASDEKFARGFEQFLRDGRGPEGLKGPFKSMSNAMREIYAQADLPDVTPEMARVLSRLFEFDKQKGGRLVGAEDFVFGQNYVPYVRGVPLDKYQPAKSMGAYIRSMNRLFGSSRKSAIGAGPDDVALRKAFEGSLLLSGFFKSDVTEASGDSLILANRLAMAHHARTELLKASTEVPSDISDVAIKVDPSGDTPEALGALWDRLDSVQQGGTKISANELEGVDFDMIEKARQDVFPARIGDGPDPPDTRQVAADILAEDTGPIENIRWISRDLIDETGLLYVPASARFNRAGLPKTIKRGAQAAGIGFDGVNDLQKALILYFNPAYVPVNLVGNLAMNTMQQGVFMPVNLWRAAMMHRALEVEDRLMIDSLMGHGLTGSLSLRTTPGKALHNTLGHYINMAVDLMPRRSAFLHEAFKEGFSMKPGKFFGQEKQDLRNLLAAGRAGDEEALKTLDRITMRANDAIVDYERMSPWEREVLSRWIFFYPWLRGASRYAIRFAADHPAQTMALALMAEHAKETGDEVIGPRPYYAEFAVPISTESIGAKIPGTDIGGSLSDLTGKASYTDEHGYPMTFNIRQVFTQTTPFEVGESIAGAITGDPNAPGLVENLTPVPYAIGTWIYGYDPFKHKEVSRGIGTLGKQLYGGFPIVRNIQAVNMSAQERKSAEARKLYPRTKGMDIQHVFGGGLTPTPINPKVANRLVEQKQTKSASEKAQQWEKDTAAELGELPPEVIKGRESKALYADATKQLKRDTGATKLSDQQRTEVKLKIVAAHFPEYSGSVPSLLEAVHGGDADTIKAVNRWAEKTLGWPLVDAYGQKAQKLKKAEGK